MLRHMLVLIATLLSLGAGIMPAQAQSGVSWTADFFNNPYFVGPPVLSQTVSTVAYNWGSESPDTNISSDNFSAQFATDVILAPGTYRFYMLADDGASVYLDFNRVLFDTYTETRPGELLSTDVVITRTSLYHIQIDYVEYDLDAFIYFAWENTNDGIQGAGFPDLTPQLTPLPDAYWVGQYHNNVDLSGSPTAIVGGTGLNFNWGTSSPVPSINPDNFSVRWNAVYTLDGGEYQVDVEADDGVRVYLDGVLIIDRWGLATGEVFSVPIRPVAGNHTFTVEFFEANGAALLNFTLFDVNTEPSSPYNAFATVTAFRLNVRRDAFVTFDNVIAQASRDEVYPVVGRSSDNNWVQIDLGEFTGWLSTTYANVTNLQNVPITYSTTPQPTGYTAFTRTEVNLRTGPGTSFERVLILPQNITIPITGRNSNGTWWQVVREGTVGWVSANYAVIQQENPDLNRIPIVSN